MKIRLPSDLQAWAEAEVAAGNAVSLDELAAHAFAAMKRRQDSIKRMAEEAIAESNREGWIGADDFLAELDAAIQEDEAEARAAGLAAE